MKLFQGLGLLCILFGAYILIKGFAYTSHKNVIEVGDFKAAVEEKKSIPPWAGGLAVVAGVGMIVIGGRRRP